MARLHQQDGVAVHAIQDSCILPEELVVLRPGMLGKD